jgi:hypothetical protein
MMTRQRRHVHHIFATAASRPRPVASASDDF